MKTIRKAIPAIAVLATCVLIILQYTFQNNPAWNNIIGFGERSQKTTSTTYIIPTPTISTNDKIPIQITETTAVQSGKSLWDWMELLVVPFVLAAGAFYLNKAERKSELEIAEDRLRENTLQAYLDKMTDLMLEKNLQGSRSSAEIPEAAMNVARVRTLTALRGLDGKRKGIVLRFLSESGLISKKFPLVNLSDADLSGANLSRADLKNINLDNVNLQNADLRGANLQNSTIRDATLEGVNMETVGISGNYKIFGKPKFWVSPNLKGGIQVNIQSKKNIMFGGISINGDTKFGITGNFILLGKILIKVNSFTNLSNADLSNSNCGNAKMMGVVLENSILNNTNLRGSDLSGANLENAEVSHSNLISTKFVGANLAGCDLEQNLFQADLFQEKINPPSTDFSCANLRGVSFYEVQLGQTKFYAADLQNTQFTKADLRGCNFHLSNITNKQLNAAESFKGAILPNGKKHK